MARQGMYQQWDLAQPDSSAYQKETLHQSNERKFPLLEGTQQFL